jgi:hypothetical protein
MRLSSALFARWLEVSLSSRPHQSAGLCNYVEGFSAASRRPLHRVLGDTDTKETTERRDRQQVLCPQRVSEDVRGFNGGARIPESGELAWKMEPELELSIDVATLPVTVRLVGTLHSQTGKNVRSVIEELVQEGHRDFSMQVECLQLPDPAGFSSLVGIQRLIKSIGGTIRWSRWPDPRR